MNIFKRSASAVVLLCGAITCLASTEAQADFGIQSFTATPTNRQGQVEERAGAHPYEFKVHIGMNLHEGGEEAPEGTLRTVVMDLPPGLVGNPLAVPRCRRVEFEGVHPNCPANTQVGFARLKVSTFGEESIVSPVWNLVPPVGSPVSLGVSLDNLNGFLEASLRTGGDYGATVSDLTIPTGIPIQAVNVSVWGVPSDQSHNPERWCREGDELIEGGCKSESLPLPFLSLPTSCTGPQTTTVHVESLDQPGEIVSKSVQSVNYEGVPSGLRDCEAPPFAPSVFVTPETSMADSPTGLHVKFHIPQSDDPEGLATSHLQATDVKLPIGLTVNPSAAAGLVSCSLDQAGLDRPGPVRCPVASKVGSVSVMTPLVDHPLEGAVYLAAQQANPFGSLLALYIAVEDPRTGVIVKQSVELEPDPQTGQVRAVTGGLPQLPFEDLEFDFTGGPRAPLTTPMTCGSFVTNTAMTPWSRPDSSVERASPFRISVGADSGPCPATEASAPNSPSFEAGTISPIAGAYSPFVLRVSRENGSQRIAAIDAMLPPGLVGKLAGIPYCSDAQIAAAVARSAPGQGVFEATSPSCPLASEVGTVDVGAGSGAPLHVTGRAYLAGPYKGAPLSIAIITPAIAGPFDLGDVVVRTALYVNEETARIHAVSDPIPGSLAGIPLDVRSISLDMSRPQFTLNPTNCNAMAVLGSAISTTGQTAALSSRFQVGACGALGFKPRLSLSLRGGTQRTQHPKLKAIVTYPKGSYANVARASVVLPRSEFIDPDRVANPCTRPQFNEGRCPKDSILGTAKAYTPLLDKPLVGKVYFRANGGERELPDMVVDLRGQVHFVLVGQVDAVVKKGTDISRIRNTFASVPDAPVSKFVLELKGGKRGLLVNSESLCTKTRRATVKLTAQNAKVHNFSPVIATSCSD